VRGWRDGNSVRDQRTRVSIMSSHSSASAPLQALNITSAPAADTYALLLVAIGAPSPMLLPRRASLTEHYATTSSVMVAL